MTRAKWIARCCFAISLIAAQPLAAQDILIKNALVYSAESKTPIEGGDIWLRGETIAGVGKTIQGSSGSQIVNGAGLWATPGIINAFSQLGASEVGNISASTDSGAKNPSFSAGFDISYGINPASTHIQATRLAGITRAGVAPVARANIFSGYGALIDLGDDAQAVFKPRAFMSAALDEQGARLAGGARGAAFVTLRESLDEASGRSGSDRFDNLLGRVDADALKPVVRGDVPLFIEVERAADILNVLALKADYRRINIVLVGANEGWLVADAIAQAQVPVISDGRLNMPRRFETLGATLANAARLQQAGVLIAIASGANERNVFHARRVLQLAGVAVSYGLAWEDALAAVTVNAAKILGAEDVIGTLSPGKRGDVVLWDGDPFEFTTQPVAIYIDGKAMPLTSRQTMLRDRYRDLSKRLPFQYRK